MQILTLDILILNDDVQILTLDILILNDTSCLFFFYSTWHIHCVFNPLIPRSNL